MDLNLILNDAVVKTEDRPSSASPPVCQFQAMGIELRPASPADVNDRAGKSSSPEVSLRAVQGYGLQFQPAGQLRRDSVQRWSAYPARSTSRSSSASASPGPQRVNHSRTAARRLGMVARHFPYPTPTPDSGTDNDDSLTKEEIKKLNKAEKEKRSRAAIAEGLGNLHRAMSDVNPNLVQEWKPLTHTNKYTKGKVSRPTKLEFNKIPVINTSICFVTHTQALLTVCIERAERIGDHAYAIELREAIWKLATPRFEEALHSLANSNTTSS